MPAFTAVGAYVATTVFGLAGTAAVVVGALVATGAAYITSRVINGNPNKGNNSAPGSQGGRIQVPPATNNKIPVAYGNAFINGTITDARLITTDQKINNTMFYCIVLSETSQSGSPTYTIDNIFYNDLRLVFDATNGYKVVKGVKKVNGPGEDFEDNNFISDGKNLVEVRVYAGGSESANQIFPTTGATPAYTYWADNSGDWNNTFAMKGLVYAIVRITYNGEKGFTGLPNMTFQLNNTVSNPADVWYDYMTGVRYGAGIPAADIDTTARTAWANFCDEDFSYTDKDGNTNQLTTRYSINGVIDTSRPVKENIDIIMQNAGAWLSYNVSTGLWSPIIKKAVTAGELGLPATYFTASRTSSTLTVTTFPAGRIEPGQLLYNSGGTLIGTISAQIFPLLAGESTGQLGRYTTSTSGNIASTTFYTLPSSMLEFDDDNIISGISISSTRLDDLYNSYEAEFYDKYNKDQRAYARDEILAGERNPNEPDNQLRLSLDLCNNSVQADLLAKLELAQSRDDLVVEFTTTHYGIQAQAGDVVSIYSDLYGWSPKYFRVMRVKEQETDEGGLVAQIQALEYNPDVYTIESLTEFTTSANIGIGVYAASPNLPLPPAVIIASVDADAAIPNFELQIEIPTTGGPFDEIELFYTEGWDQHPITGTIVPGTGSNGAPVGQGLLTVTATTYGNINAGDRIDLLAPAQDIFIVSQITNTVGSKTFVSGGVPASTTSTLLTLNNVTGLLVGNTLTGTGIPDGSFIIEIDAGTNTVRIEDAVTVQAAGTYQVTGGLGTYIVDTSTTISGTTDLYDFPEADNYKPLKIIVPQGNTATFTNGEIIRDVITNVPANSATYRRWFIKARMGIKKRFGAFSQPGDTDFDQGRFPYSPNPSGSGGAGVFSSVDINNTTPWLTFSTQPDGVNPKHGVRGRSTQDDYWFVGGASAGDDLGYLELATADNAGGSNSGGEIYVRQYNGAGAGGPEWVTGGTGTAQRTLTLLDNLGNTQIPQNLTVDSGTLFVDATNNRVGVNDTTPSFSLDVTGDANITSNLTVDTDTLFVNATTDRVGINTATPGYTLDVNGDANIDSNLTVLGSTFLGNNYIIDSTSVVGNFSVTNNSVNNLQVLYSNGYVGINNAAPAEVLDVIGNGKFSGNVAVNGGDITTTDASANIFNTGATDINIGNGATTAVRIGANDAASIVLIKPGILVGERTTQNVFNTVATTVNAFGASTATAIGAGTGTTTIGNDLAVKGTTLTLNSDGTGTEDITILFERAASDTYIKYNETTDRFEFASPITTLTNLGARFSEDLFGTGYHGVVVAGTNGTITIGGNLTFQRQAGSAAGTNAVITVDRATTDASITWNESNTRWEISNDLNVPQATIGNIDIDRTNGTITTNTGDLTLDSASGTVLIDDNLNVASGVLFVDDSNNFVGINKTTPTEALDVTGSILASIVVKAPDIVIDQGDITHISDASSINEMITSVRSNTIVGTGITVVDSWSPSLGFRSAKYTFTCSKGGDHQSVEVMIIHDGTNSYLNTYSDIATGINLITISTDITGFDPVVNFKITPTTTGTLKYILKKELFKLV